MRRLTDQSDLASARIGALKVDGYETQAHGVAEDGDWQSEGEARAAQGECRGQGQASVPHREDLRHEEGTLQGANEEHGAAIHAVRPGESAERQAAIVCARRHRCFLKWAK